MKLSIIGTSIISTKMLEAIKLYPEIELDYICSRSSSKGEEFIQQYGFKNHVSTVEELAQTNTEAVYIASPNSFHYPQAKILIEQGKHILLEKAFTSNSIQAKELIELAKMKNVVLMEAIVTPFLPNFKKLQEIIPPNKEIIHVNLAFAKVSSKLNDFIKGNNTNIFSSEMSAGSLMDLGVYGIWFAVALWGEPKKISYHSLVKLSTGVDGKGLLVLSYHSFDVKITHSKISNDGLDAHIYTKKRQIIGSDFSILSRILDIDTHQHIIKDVSVAQQHTQYYYELGEFLRCVITGDKSFFESLENTIIVMDILDEARKQAKIVFPDDIPLINTDTIKKPLLVIN